ncbi:WXG100 family type VII secretion target [Paenibacillus sp. FSL M8-0334]|uniref:WXG100 family type VII secretion target n=1 Tax=Paenibacillus sp. FSL M8-0334 TaxID=2921623 RepID=UPI0030F7282C
MSRILVTPEMLLRVAAQCSNAHEQLESMIHTLNQSIHTLASGWEGTTRSRFYADFQRAHREMTQTTEHIQRTSLELKAIAQRFKAADERVQPIQVAGHTLGAFPMMRGPAGYRAVDNAGRKVEESWNAVQHEAGEFWEGLKIGAMQFGSSLKDTAISLFEDPLGTGKSMLYNATIGTAEDIRDTAIWAGRMLFSNEYRDKVVEDTMQEVEAAGGWSTYLGTQSAMIIGGALLNRAGLRVGGPRNNKHDDLGGGNSGGSGSGNGGSDRGGGNNSGDGDGRKPGNEGKGDTVGNFAGKINTENIPNMSKQEILDSLPKDWKYTENNGFVHIRDANGNVRMKIDPPDKVTKYDHVHLFDESGNPIDVNLNVVDRKSPDAHIPYKK